MGAQACNMGSKADTRNKIIGGKHRAMSRYYLMVNRCRALTKKNSSYAGISVDISIEDFVEWFMRNDFEGCSVDRIDNRKNYTMDNIQLIPTPNNIAKDKITFKDGKGVCRVCKREKPEHSFVVDNRRMFIKRDTICKECENYRCRERDKKKRSTGV